MLEFVPGGEFFVFIRKKEQLKANIAAIYSSHVVIMLSLLHSQKIVYRDLKPENLLFSPNGYLKLSDFGFCKLVKFRTFTLCGTPEYIAPEILLNQGHGLPVDYWALGVLIYEMHYGIDPFSSEDPLEVYRKILENKIKFAKSFNTECKSIVGKLVETDLTRRYGNLKNGI